MYEYVTMAGSSQVGPDQRLTLGAAVDEMQDCEWFDIMGEPGIKLYFEEFGVGMVVIFRQLDLMRRPFLGERLTVKTWAYDCTRLLGFRNTLILDEQGKVCAAANSIGAFVETAQGRSTRVAQRIADGIFKGERFEMEYLSRKIPAPQRAGTGCEAVRVGRHFIDGNGHMNNARYLELAEDCLPEGTEFDRIRVEYRMPARSGERIVPTRFEPESGVESGAASAVGLVVLENGMGAVNALVEFSRMQL